MTAYQTIVVGTDGSDSSYKAVEKAARLAADAGAELVLACAYYPTDERSLGALNDALKEDAYQVHGSAPTDEILRSAKEKAIAVGATDITVRPIVGAPVEALLELVGDVSADLLVIGNRGLNSITGRLLGSVPSDVARKSKSDVLIVHTV